MMATATTTTTSGSGGSSSSSSSRSILRRTPGILVLLWVAILAAPATLAEVGDADANPNSDIDIDIDASCNAGVDATDESIIPSLRYGIHNEEDNNSSSGSSNSNSNSDKATNDATRAKDFAEYFSAYGELHHQKDMLTDAHRMESYYNAITKNAKDVFANKIVLDVGTGSGILAVWAAKAGAKKVYAIEYTNMAENAKLLAKANGVENVVTVLRGTVEGLTLPLKEDGFLGTDDDDDDDDKDNQDHHNERIVDVIVSEWMGYVLLRESMLDSVLVARDRYLRRDTGMMFPSHATIWGAPFSDEPKRLAGLEDFEAAMEDWHSFVEHTQETYGGVDYSVLTDRFEKEQRDWYLYQSEWRELEAEAVVATPTILKTLDLMTCTHNDTRGLFATNDNDKNTNGNADTNRFDFWLDASTPTTVSGLAVWFTTDFRSRTDAMVSNESAPRIIHPVTLTTGPEQGYTHWGQQAFYFLDAIRVPDEYDAEFEYFNNWEDGDGDGDWDGDENDSAQTSASSDATTSTKTMTTTTTTTASYHLTGSLELFRTKDNARLYKCSIEHALEERTLDTDTARVLRVRKTHPVEAVYLVP